MSLWKDGMQKDWLVARLIAMAWHGVPKDGMTVNHINGDPLDNRAENLEWCSLADNIRHGFYTGLYDSNSKPITLVDTNENEISFYSYAEASRFLGRQNGYVSNMVQKSFKYAKSVWGERFTYKAGDLS